MDQAVLIVMVLAHESERRGLNLGWIETETLCNALCQYSLPNPEVTLQEQYAVWT